MNEQLFRGYHPILGMSKPFTMKEAVNDPKYMNYFTFMMYSGFNDKKGNEIFQDDIVLVTEDPSSPRSRSFITEVIFESGCFFLKDIDGSKIALLDTELSTYPNGHKSIIIEEVLGSIHEKSHDNNIHIKLEEAKQLFKDQIKNTLVVVTEEHEEDINKNVNKIIDLIYQSCMESLRNGK